MQSTTRTIILFLVCTSFFSIAQKDTMYLNVNGEKVTPSLT